jgi:hypothetical protein
MTGQIGTGTFDVNTLLITEAGDPPTNIIATGKEFKLSLTFEGSGTVFNGFANLATQYSVSYFMEGIGANADERDLGAVPKNLAPGKFTYKDADTELTIPAAANNLKPGVYRVAGVVTFPAVPGMTGFTENLLVEVYKP